MTLIAPVLFSLAVSALCLFFGRRLMGLTGRNAGILWPLGIGFAALSYLLFGLALLGSLKAPAILIVFAVMTVLSWKEIKESPFHIVSRTNRWLAGVRQLVRERDWFAFLFLAVWAAESFLNLVNSLAPITEGDSLHTYLTAPKWWAIWGHVAKVPSSFFNGFYGVAIMLNALSLTFHFETAALLLSGFAFGLFTSFAIYALTRKLGGTRGAAIAAAALTVCLPDVWYEAAAAKIDMAAAFYSVLAVIALSENYSKEIHRGIWVGVFTGIAVWTKMGAFELACALIPILPLFCPPKARKSIIPSLLLYGLVAFVLLAPGMLFNWHEHGNPFHPVGVPPFAGKEGGIAFVENRANGGMTDHYYFGYLGPFKAMLRNTYVDRFHGYGPFFLTFLPIFIWGLWKTGPTGRKLGLFFVVYFLLWNFIRQLARDMDVLLGLNAAVVMIMLWREELWPSARTALKLTALACAGVLMAQNLMSILFFERFHYAFSRQTRAEYLEKVVAKLVPAIPRWDMVHWVNTNIPADKVSINWFTGNAYYFDRPTLTRTDLQAELRAETDEQKLLKKLSDNAIGYIFISKADFADLQKTPGILLQSDFLNRYTTEVFANEHARILQLNIDGRH